MKYLWLLLVLFTIGCETPTTPKPKQFPAFYNREGVQIAVTDRNWREAIPQVKVYQPGMTVSGTNDIVAFMSAGGNARDEARWLAVMIREAQFLGANGLVILSTEAPNATVSIAHPIWQNPGDRVFRANAIILR